MAVIFFNQPFLYKHLQCLVHRFLFLDTTAMGDVLSRWKGNIVLPIQTTAKKTIDAISLGFRSYSNIWLSTIKKLVRLSFIALPMNFGSGYRNSFTAQFLQHIYCFVKVHFQIFVLHIGMMFLHCSTNPANGYCNFLDPDTSLDRVDGIVGNDNTIFK